jgi:hypothetical protein
MSNANPQPALVNGPEAKSPPAKARPAASQLIPLSELAHQKLTVQDIMGLLPAAIISLVFNSVIVGLLLLTSNQASANRTPTVTEIDEETQVTDKNDKEEEMIDFSAISLDGGLSTDSLLETGGLELPMVEVAPDTTALPGTGEGNEGGFQGVEDTGTVGIPGIPGAGVGFLPDKGGSLLPGEGFGLPGGIPGTARGGHRGFRAGRGQGTEMAGAAPGTRRPLVAQALSP